MSKSNDLLNRSTGKYFADGRKDLTFGFKDRPLYLPAISNAYVRTASWKTLNLDGPRKGAVPSFLEHEYDSFNFFKRDKGAYSLSHALFSAGHANLNPDKQDAEAMIQERNRDDTWVLGDSGGYQIASGLLKYDWDKPPKACRSDIRYKILEYLEQTADYSMVLDIPTRALDNPAAKDITRFEDCLAQTKQNNEFFLKYRKNKTQYLNILQGRTVEECDMWYNNVKHYDFEGWAMGGHQNLALSLILRRFIIMRDEKMFEANANGVKRNWVHMLGQSRPAQFCFYNTIQRELRKQLNDPDFQLSGDSASPYLQTANGNAFIGSYHKTSRLSYLADGFPDSKKLLGSDMLVLDWLKANVFPKYDGAEFVDNWTVMDKMRIKDLCVKDDTYNTKSSWDTISYSLMMMVGQEALIEGLHRTMDVWESPTETFVKHMPENLILLREEVLPAVLNSEEPMKHIQRYNKMLNNLTGRKMENIVRETMGNDLFNVIPDVHVDHTDEKVECKFKHADSLGDDLFG